MKFFGLEGWSRSALRCSLPRRGRRPGCHRRSSPHHPTPAPGAPHAREPTGHQGSRDADTRRVASFHGRRNQRAIRYCHRAGGLARRRASLGVRGEPSASCWCRLQPAPGPRWRRRRAAESPGCRRSTAAPAAGVLAFRDQALQLVRCQPRGCSARISFEGPDNGPAEVAVPATRWYPSASSSPARRRPGVDPQALCWRPTISAILRARDGRGGLSAGPAQQPEASPATCSGTLGSSSRPDPVSSATPLPGRAVVRLTAPGNTTTPKAGSG